MKIKDDTTQVLPKLVQAKERGPYSGMVLTILLGFLLRERVKE